METVDEKPARLPVLSIQEILRWKRKIHDYLFPYYGQKACPEIMQDLTELLTKDLIKTRAASAEPTNTLEGGPMPAVYAAVLDTFRAYAAGEIMDEPLANYISVRMAGNLTKLRAGHAVHPFSGLLSMEWVLATIVDATPYTTPKKRIPGALFKFMIHSGTASGEILEQFFPHWIINNMAKKLKLLKTRQRRIVIPRELVKFKLVLRLEQGAEGMTATQFKERDALNKWNKSLAESRELSTRHCPKRYTIPCHTCEFGFETCSMGTHRTDYVLGECRSGHSGYIAPGNAGGYCVLCETKRWRAAR